MDNQEQENEELGFDKATAIGLMQNAIGYEMFCNDGREVTANEKGVAGITLTDQEVEATRRAATKAFEYLQEWLIEGAPPADA